jgi:hypothetical protein
VTDPYFTIPAESASSLKPLLHSAKLYRYHKDNGREPTDPMRLGTAAHVAVLEPHRYGQCFAVWAERAESGRKSPRSATNGKYQDFILSNPGRTILTEEQSDEARAMAAAVHANPIAAALLAAGEPEVPIQWTHGSGIPMKSRLDWLRGDCIVDLKTTRSLAQFPVQAARLRYPMQAAIYVEAVRQRRTVRLPFKFVVVENKPPFDVGVYTVPTETMAVGERDFEKAIERLLECHERQEWPGLGAEEMALVLPPWAHDDGDDEWEVTEEAA